MKVMKVQSSASVTGRACCTIQPFIRYSLIRPRSVHACFQPQRDEDQFRDPLGPGNEDTIRRRLAVEAVRRKQEEKDAQARKQFESHEEDKGAQKQKGWKQEDKGEAPRADPELYEGITVKNAKLDKPKSLEDITRIVLEQQQKASRRGQSRKPSPDHKEYNPLLPALTRGQEVFLGRTAMVGITMACFWEVYFPDHPSITAQLSRFTGLPPHYSGLLLLSGIVTTVVLGTLWPKPPSLSNKADLQELSGRPSLFVNPLKHPKRFLGIERSGLTRRDELFHGRLAMFGFWIALLQEARLSPSRLFGGLNGLGPGPLAQVALYLGMPADDRFYAQVPVFILSILSAFFTYRFARWLTRQGQDEDE